MSSVSWDKEPARQGRFLAASKGDAKKARLELDQCVQLRAKYGVELGHPGESSGAVRMEGVNKDLNPVVIISKELIDPIVPENERMREAVIAFDEIEKAMDKGIYGSKWILILDQAGKIRNEGGLFHYVGCRCFLEGRDVWIWVNGVLFSYGECIRL